MTSSDPCPFGGDDLRENKVSPEWQEQRKKYMQVLKKGLCLGFLLSLFLAPSAFAQKAFTWQEVRTKFEALNPTLRAGLIGIDEFKASEITAYLRPNPSFTLSTDGTQVAPNNGIWQPFKGTLFTPAFSYLHERQHKRELRRESAQKGAGIAVSSQADLDRTLVATLRAAFIQVLQEKAILALAKENIAYYDHVLNVNRERYKAGAIAQVDLDRLELQRVTYEADLQNAIESLETAKIQLLTLLNDRTPPEAFDVTGPYDFSPQIPAFDDV
ncbi:MAG TPA: TolC family protein, partial [Candidatus Dormibacteraeota bacterium]|nr:TolC family protein [Candidatus Dormibacteraeota bacterium]